MSLSLTDLFTFSQERIESVGRSHLQSNENYAPILHEAMNYAVFNGGKRIRPTLIYAVGQALGADANKLDAAACAIEFIHCYSLVHDDLPAMDNSDLRRGKPSCHKAYNEPLAILVGDALQAHAFEILAANTENLLRADQIVAMIRVLAKAGGLVGIAAGQALDIHMINHEMNLPKLQTLCRLKTGVLLEACIQLALIGADQPDTTIKYSLLHYAQALGLAFQLQDDLLDIESTAATLGKPQGQDSQNNKITYPILAGIDQTKHKIAELHQEVLSSIQFLGDKGKILEEFAEYLLHRTR